MSYYSWNLWAYIDSSSGKKTRAPAVLDVVQRGRCRIWSDFCHFPNSTWLPSSLQTAVISMIDRLMPSNITHSRYSHFTPIINGKLIFLCKKIFYHCFIGYVTGFERWRGCELCTEWIRACAWCFGLDEALNIMILSFFEQIVAVRDGLPGSGPVFDWLKVSLGLQCP